MILPSKHVSEQQALIGVGGTLLAQLEIPKTVNALWERVRACQHVGTFERFILALDLLYILGAVELRDGLIIRGGDAS